LLPPPNALHGDTAGSARAAGALLGALYFTTGIRPSDRKLDRRSVQRSRLAGVLRPCPGCGGEHYRVSALVYLSDFRLVLCEGCGRTEWYANDLEDLLARPEFKRRVRVRVVSPYR
jgi:hypothetical protein